VRDAASCGGPIPPSARPAATSRRNSRRSKCSTARCLERSRRDICVCRALLAVKPGGQLGQNWILNKLARAPAHSVKRVTAEEEQSRCLGTARLFVSLHPGHCSAVQCSAVQCSAVQCSGGPRRVRYAGPGTRMEVNRVFTAAAPQGCSEQCSAVQCSAVQCSAVCSTVQCSAVQCSAVQCSVQCSAVQCSALYCTV
jgi:hypothetical protein